MVEVTEGPMDEDNSVSSQSTLSSASSASETECSASETGSSSIDRIQDVELDVLITDLAFQNLMQLEQHRYMASRVEHISKDLTFYNEVLPYLSDTRFQQFFPMSRSNFISLLKIMPSSITTHGTHKFQSPNS